ESQKFYGKVGKLVEAPVRGPVFDDDIPALDVSPLTQTLLKRLDPGGRRLAHAQDADPIHLSRLLRLGRARSGEDADRANDHESDPPHETPPIKPIPNLSLFGGCVLSSRRLFLQFDATPGGSHDSFCDGGVVRLLLAILIGSVYTAGPSEPQDRQRAFRISLTPTRDLIRTR